MSLSTSPAILLALLLAAPVWAQETPNTDGETGPDTKNGTKEAEASPGQEPGAKAGAAGEKAGKNGRVVKADKDEQVKVLKPKDVPAELGRLKSKADIKAEVTIRPHHGRAATFKGVIRNGKLIERFAKRRFRSEKSLEHPRCGVRLWWIGNASGWMFFRYSNIQSIALTGRLTAEERAEIMRRLKGGDDRDEDKAKEASAAADFQKQLDKLSESELKSFLMRTFQEDDGWDRKRHRELKRKSILENKPLDREEAIFIKYYSTLMKARLEKLKRLKTKVEIEPGSESPRSSPGNSGPGGDASGLPPGTIEPSSDD